MKKRTLCFLLAVVIMLGIIPPAAVTALTAEIVSVINTKNTGVNYYPEFEYQLPVAMPEGKTVYDLGTIRGKSYQMKFKATTPPEGSGYRIVQSVEAYSVPLNKIMTFAYMNTLDGGIYFDLENLNIPGQYEMREKITCYDSNNNCVATVRNTFLLNWQPVYYNIKINVTGIDPDETISVGFYNEEVGYSWSYAKLKLGANEISGVRPGEFVLIPHSLPDKYTKKNHVINIEEEGDEFNIHYDTNPVVNFYDGDHLLETRYVEIGTSMDRPDADPYREDAYFAGWYTEDGEPYNFFYETVTSSFDLYAKYYYKISVNYNDSFGTVTGKGNYMEGSTVTLKAIPISNDYLFGGWFDTVTGDVCDDSVYSFKAEEHRNIDAYFYPREPEVWIEGVPLRSGEYFADGVVTETRPSTGCYAYYNQGELYLNNYSYKGTGTGFGENGDINSVIYAIVPIEIVVNGVNIIMLTSETDGTGIYLEEGGTIRNNNISGGTVGELRIEGGWIGIHNNGDPKYMEFTCIESSTVNLYGSAYGLSGQNSIIINGGAVNITATRYAVNTTEDFYVYGGTLSAKCINTSSMYDDLYYAIHTDGEFGFGDSLIPQISTEINGPLTYDFLFSQVPTYDYITLTPASDQYIVIASPDYEERGTVTGSNVYTYNSIATIEAIPADGYQFVEWNKNGIAVSTDPKYSFVVTSDCEIYALFERKPCMVTFNADGGSNEEAHSAISIISFDTYILPECEFTAPDGFFFGAWIINGERFAPGEAITVYDDIRIRAFWIKSTYTVNFHSDATTEMSVSVNYAHNVEIPEAPQKEGYNFVGWYTESGLRFNFTEPVTEDIELYARFKVVLMGDANDDGVIDAKDLVRIKKQLALGNVVKYDENADMNDDGVIDEKDLEMLAIRLQSQ